MTQMNEFVKNAIRSAEKLQLDEFSIVELNLESFKIYIKKIINN